MANVLWNIYRIFTPNGSIHAHWSITHLISRQWLFFLIQVDAYLCGIWHSSVLSAPHIEFVWFHMLNIIVNSDFPAVFHFLSTVYAGSSWRLQGIYVAHCALVHMREDAVSVFAAWTVFIKSAMIIKHAVLHRKTVFSPEGSSCVWLTEQVTIGPRLLSGIGHLFSWQVFDWRALICL